MANILIIDDDQALRVVLRRVLERAGHTVREAANGARGLDLHKVEPADVVVIDLYMPGEDGLAIVRRLRREWPGTPTIVISGNLPGPPQPAARAQFLSAWIALPKPFEPQELLDAVARLLKAKEPYE